MFTTAIYIVLFVVFFFWGDMLDFPGVFSFGRDLQGKKVGHFFKIHFFSFLQLHILPQGRQVGKVGGW